MHFNAIGVNGAVFNRLHGNCMFGITIGNVKTWSQLLGSMAGILISYNELEILVGFRLVV